MKIIRLLQIPCKFGILSLDFEQLVVHIVYSASKTATSYQQVWNKLVTTLLILSDLLQGCYNKAVTIMI